MPSAERWTTDTEALVVQAIGDPGSFLPRGDDYRESIPRWGMRAALTALADAGLLLPPGGVIRDELSWSHRDGSDCTTPDYCAPYTERVERRITEWPDGTELTTPWMPVDRAEDAAEGGPDVG